MGLSFFQSPVRRQLQEIFDREIFEKNIDGTTYWGIRRSKKIGPITISWDQILGAQKVEELKNIATLQKDSAMFGDVYLQLGSDDVLWQGDVHDAKADETIQTIMALRNERYISMQSLGFAVSWRENMPLATIVTPCGVAEDLRKLMHKDHRRYLNKAMKHDLLFEVAKKSDWPKFYVVWKELAASKGLGIMSKIQFLTMMSYLHENNLGKLFLAKKGANIVSGSVCVWEQINHLDASEQQGIVYLYGATARGFGNIGGHIFLQHHIMQRGHEHGYVSFDHWGVAPAGFDHHLSGVSRFKERFGGMRVEYVGNFDVVKNKPLYQALKFIKKH